MTEEVFLFEDGPIKFSEEAIHYNSSHSPQPMVMVGPVEYFANLFRTRHTVNFRVYLPHIGRWGSDDFGSYQTKDKAKALRFKDLLEKTAVEARARASEKAKS